MDVREIIAATIYGGSTFSKEERLEIGAEAIKALEAAGYRIVSGLDPGTLEAAAKCADRAEVMNTHKLPGMGEGRTFAIVQAKIDISRDIAAAIRALNEGRGP